MNDTATSYDEIPYLSKPVERAHPGQLAVLGGLFGLETAPAHRCRVLELGCGTGRNLCGLAAAYPESEFVGIDLSQVQITEGRKLIQNAELNNLHLEHLSILDFDSSYGNFDYIVCHGILSWVSQEIRESIFNIFSNSLNPHGVAFVSYNTFPGWHIRLAIREMMAYPSRNHSTPKERVEAARKSINFIAKAISQNKNYDALFKTELEKIRNLPDWYLFHDLLEEHNHPFYFHSFASLAQQFGLQYLCEAEIPKILPQEFTPALRQEIAKLATSHIEQEQYVDFLRNRMFRRSLLVHDSVNLDRALPPSSVQNYYIASRLKTAASSTDKITDSSEMTLSHPNGGRLKTSVPLAKAAICYLAEIWPRSVQFDDLLAAALGYITSHSQTPYSLTPKDREEFSNVIFRAFMADLIELHRSKSLCSSYHSECPELSKLARIEAQAGSFATNLRNEQISISPFERLLIPLLDGTNKVETLCEKMQSIETDKNSDDIGREVEASLKRLTEQAFFLEKM